MENFSDIVDLSRVNCPLLNTVLQTMYLRTSTFRLPFDTSIVDKEEQASVNEPGGSLCAVKRPSVLSAQHLFMSESQTAPVVASSVATTSPMTVAAGEAAKE
jgi:hypothetical protein